MDQTELTQALNTLRRQFPFTELSAQRAGEDWRVRAAMSPPVEHTVEGESVAPESDWIPADANPRQRAKLLQLVAEFRESRGAFDMAAFEANLESLRTTLGSLDAAISRLDQLSAAEGLEPEEIQTEFEAAEPVRGTTAAGLARRPRHHILPQEHRDTGFNFVAHGFTGPQDIDRFTVELDVAEHQAIHGGGNWRLGRTWTGEWNTMVISQLEAAEGQKLNQSGDPLTVREIWSIVTRLMRLYNIPQSFVPYRR